LRGTDHGALTSILMKRTKGGKEEDPEPVVDIENNGVPLL
jgi:hypothetical protein